MNIIKKTITGLLLLFVLLPLAAQEKPDTVYTFRFVTKNHSGSGDYVTVRISVPKVATAAQKDERQQDGQESADTQQEQRETEESRFVAEQIRADSMVVERQGPPLRPLGGHAGSALVYGQGEARLPRCDVQGRAVQL